MSFYFKISHFIQCYLPLFVKFSNLWSENGFNTVKKSKKCLKNVSVIQSHWLVEAKSQLAKFLDSAEFENVLYLNLSYYCEAALK